jgi:phage protein D
MSAATVTTSSQVEILVQGAPLDPSVYALLVSAEVETCLFVPSRFRLVFRGKPTDILDAGALQLATPVTIRASSDGMPVPLIAAEVTGQEIEHNYDATFVIVRGMDRSHRLMHGTVIKGYLDMTASAVVTQLVSEAEIPPGEITETTNIYNYLTQPNVSPWVFIQQLAALENCVAYVDSLGLFQFGPMTEPSEGMPPVLSYDVPPSGTQLVLGKNLVRLRASVTGAMQVPSVTVTGYNYTTTEPVIGESPSIPSTAMPADPGALPDVVAGEFGGSIFYDAERPFDTEGAAESRARAIAAVLAGALSDMEGECLGDPKVQANSSISLGMVGSPFDGQYLCTSARHVFEAGAGGYTTWFTVGGRQSRSLYASTSGTAPASPGQGNIPGLVIGKVTNNVDDQDLGRVQVTFPWLSPDYVSAWARTVQIGASDAGSGFLWVPEVGDEVLVGFDRGNIDYPFVIGNLYNGVYGPSPPPQINAGVASRRIASRERHTILFDDGPDALGITIQTGDQSCSIKMDAQEQTISVISQGTVQVKAGEQGLAIMSDGDITIGATGNISLSSDTGTVSVEASAGSLSMSGADVSVSGDSSVSVSSASISLGP